MLLSAGGHAAGAGGVGAERQRHQTRGDRNRRARARSARDQRRIERIARHAIGRAHADQAGGELVEVGLADDDGAGAFEPRDGGRVPAGIVGKRRAGGGRRQAGDVDVVLDRDRHAEQRPALRARRFQRLGFRKRRGLLAQADEDRRIAMRPDARETAGHRLGWTARSRDMGADNRGNGLGHYRSLRQQSKAWRASGFGRAGLACSSDYPDRHNSQYEALRANARRPSPARSSKCPVTPRVTCPPSPARIAS